MDNNLLNNKMVTEIPVPSVENIEVTTEDTKTSTEKNVKNTDPKTSAKKKAPAVKTNNTSSDSADIDEIVYATYCGQYGTGEACEKALNELGYDYKKIMAEVHKKYK